MEELIKKENILNNIRRSARKTLFLNTYIQIIDNEKVIVENCKHIVECDDILVKLLTADFYIQIWGQLLTISDFNSEYVIVNGKVSSIEILPRGKGNRNDL